MKRLTALLAAAMLVTAGLPAAAAVAGQPSNSGVQPGAQFAGAVGVQGAEVEGEVEERALDRRFAAADSNDSRARVVAAESERASERLDALRERRSDLRERYENGSVSESEYRVRLASIAAEARTLERRLNGTAAAARSLPPEAARERGVNASEVAGLRDEADELHDDEAAEAARGVAGDGVGNGLGPPSDGNEGDDDERSSDDRGNGDGSGPPDDAGPDDRRGGGANDRANGNGTVDGNTTDDDASADPGAGDADENASRPGDRGNGTGGVDAGNGSGAGPGENRGNGADDRGNDEGMADDDAAEGDDSTETDDPTAVDATLTPTPTDG